MIEHHSSNTLRYLLGNIEHIRGKPVIALGQRWIHFPQSNIGYIKPDPSLSAARWSSTSLPSSKRGAKADGVLYSAPNGLSNQRVLLLFSCVTPRVEHGNPQSLES